MSGGYIVHRGVHVPACISIDDHIEAAVRESSGLSIDLMDFVDEVRADWAEEQQIADSGDAAVIAYWRAVEADHLARFLS